MSWYINRSGFLKAYEERYVFIAILDVTGKRDDGIHEVGAATSSVAVAADKTGY
ncbi:hypothetical protein [Sodalis sp. RH22]|uniref:hypothetical protein n=1 Tax=unclassified Sodalis (in: enterobacteria) TaxID=2636512 RepID=UPI0039B483BD